MTSKEEALLGAARLAHTDAVLLLAELSQLDADLRVLAHDLTEGEHDEYGALDIERRLGYLDGLEFAAHRILRLVDGPAVKQ